MIHGQKNIKFVKMFKKLATGTKQILYIPSHSLYLRFILNFSTIRVYPKPVGCFKFLFFDYILYAILMTLTNATSNINLFYQNNIII